MSFWAKDPELFLHKGQDGVVHVLRCKKETATSSSSSMLMKPEDFTDEGAVTDLRSLTGGSYEWDKNKYEALIDYIYPRHLLVNCHGSLIVELEPDEKSVNKKAVAVVYIRALDIKDMGCYGPGPDHPGKAVPVRTIKYLQDGTVVQTEPTPKEMKLSKEVETLQQELLLAKEKTAVELAKKMELTEELAKKSKEIETLQQLLAKEKTEMEVLIKKIAEIEMDLKLSVPLPKVRIYTKANLGCSLTIRNGYQVVLGQNDPYGDACQTWVKAGDMYGETVKDDITGFPSFALVNNSTGQALKPINLNSQLELVPYNRYVVDKSILWTEVKVDGYSYIRKAIDPNLNMYASSSEGVIGDGTNVGIGYWTGADNQKWFIASYS